MATPGRDNLYELHYDGKGWTTTFIATLAAEDSPEWEANAIADTHTSLHASRPTDDIWHLCRQHQ